MTKKIDSERELSEYQKLDQRINQAYQARKEKRKFKKAMNDYKNKNELIKKYKKVFEIDVLGENKISI